MASSWRDEADAYAKKYVDEIKKQNRYRIDQQNQAKDNALAMVENQRANAINQINDSRKDIMTDAESSAKQANINRMLALKDNNSAMARAGLNTQGIVGSQVNSINNSYGNDLTAILNARSKQLRDNDNQATSTNLQYDNARLNAINQYDQSIADINSDINEKALNQYNTMYGAYMNQAQQDYENDQKEKAAAEARRQFEIEQAYKQSQADEAKRQYDTSLEYQKEQDKISNAQKWAQINNNNTGGNNVTFKNGIPYQGGKPQINTDWWQGDINSDVQYGTFKTTDKNGVRYQPDNVAGAKLHSSGFKVGDIVNGARGNTGADLSSQTLWSTGDNWYVWDGSQNKYINVTGDVANFIAHNPSYVSKIK